MKVYVVGVTEGSGVFPDYVFDTKEKAEIYKSRTEYPEDYGIFEADFEESPKEVEVKEQ